MYNCVCTVFRFCLFSEGLMGIWLQWNKRCFSSLLWGSKGTPNIFDSNQRRRNLILLQRNKNVPWCQFFVKAQTVSQKKKKLNKRGEKYILQEKDQTKVCWLCGSCHNVCQLFLSFVYFDGVTLEALVQQSRCANLHNSEI